MLTHQRSWPFLLNEARTLGCPDRKRWLVHCSCQDSITSQGWWWSWSPHEWGWVLSERSVVSGIPGWLCVSTWRLLLSWSLYDCTYRFIVLPVFPLQLVLLASWYLSSFIDILVCLRARLYTLCCQAPFILAHCWIPSTWHIASA